VRAAAVIAVLEKIQSKFNEEQLEVAQVKGKRKARQISLADLIVLGGNVGVEQAARAAGSDDVEVLFEPGRADATAEETDIDTFAVLEPKADGFRNFISPGVTRPAAEMLVDRAHKLSLSAPELAVLVAGLRVLNTNVGGSAAGVLTTRPETLTNDFFVHLLDMGTTWTKVGDVYEGKDVTGTVVWTATDVDLTFGSNSQLRAIAETYASRDAADGFVDDFVYAWFKVMSLDRFDLERGD
jgi:catalase-peroxidase